MNDEIRYAIALSQIKGLGLHSLTLLLAQYPTPKSIFAAASSIPHRIPKLRTEIWEQIARKSTLDRANQILEHCEKHNIQLLLLQEKQYPELLKHIHLPPIVLYVMGDASFLQQQPVVALVGTRKMTGYGKQHIGALCKELAPHNIPIVCGLGEGVERCVTQEALRHKLPPIVVYPGGFQHPYPSNTPLTLIEKAREQGCLVSECPPDEPLQRHGFLARNRIIAGLSEQLIVIESGKKGGAMQLAYLAQAEHRDVYALPGDIDKVRSEGTNLLIQRQVAQLLQAPEDMLTALKLQQAIHTPHTLQHHFSAEEQNIIEILGTNSAGMHIDSIVEHTNIPIDKLSLFLFNLECQQTIELLPGNNYRVRF